VLPLLLQLLDEGRLTDSKVLTDPPLGLDTILLLPIVDGAWYIHGMSEISVYCPIVVHSTAPGWAMRVRAGNERMVDSG